MKKELKKGVLSYPTGNMAGKGEAKSLNTREPNN